MVFICTFCGYLKLHKHNQKISLLGDFYNNKEKLELRGEAINEICIFFFVQGGGYTHISRGWRSKRDL